MKIPEQHKTACVNQYITKLPNLLSVRVYLAEKKGESLTLAQLQEHAKSSFNQMYKMSFDLLSEQSKGSILAVVGDVHTRLTQSSYREDKAKHYNSVTEFLHKIPTLVSVKTYQDKKKTGRHSTEVALQKHARETFTKAYNIRFESLSAEYQNHIIATVRDVYFGLKQSRQL